MSENHKTEENVVTETTTKEQTLSDNKDLNRKIKLVTVALIAITLLWVFVLNPMITFKRNESTFTKSAIRYFETYTSELPTGERIGEISLQQLYEKGYVTTDFYVPYRLLSKKTCSVTDSWVKVRRVDGEYKYYTYLKCGVLSSMVDHTGPKIALNDKTEITVNLGDEFKDPGIKKIKDAQDGEIDIEKATIKGEVDTSKMGTYEISYIAFDSLRNRTEVVRTVKVVQQLSNTIKKATENTGYYVGITPKNYLYFSGMLFRIVDVEGNNVRIVADRDVANVNYSGIDKWLDYYYDHIDESAKKLVVKNKYCSMTLNDADTNASNCSSYTKKLNVYIPSVVDVNRADTEEGNFLKPATMSWVAEKQSDNKSYVTRYVFFDELEGKSFVPYEDKLNFGVRPMLTIKGDILITAGDGSKESPYELGEFSRATAGDKVNTRQSGEYLEIDGRLWQIVDPQSDGTTKVIADFSLLKNGNFQKIGYTRDEKNQTYNPNKKDNVGYIINNSSSEYIETKYFVKHEIEVPIYKDDVMYGKEIKTEKYKATIFAPNTYEMFSAASAGEVLRSYWLINSSKNMELKYGVSDIGTIKFDGLFATMDYGVRPTAFLDKGTTILGGSGTREDPYKIEK